MAGQIAPSPSNLLGVGEDYKRLHALSLLNKPSVNLENEEFAVAVLQHDKSPSSCQLADFLWFKVKNVSSKRIFHN